MAQKGLKPPPTKIVSSPVPQQQVQVQQQPQQVTMKDFQEISKDIKETISKSLDKLDTKLMKLDQKMANSLEEVTSELTEIREQINQRNKDIREDIIAAFTGLAGNVQALEEEIDQLKQDKSNLEQRMMKIESQTDKLEQENIALQYREMEYAVRIRGLREEKDENLKEICVQAFAGLLEANPDHIRYDIEKVYRVNSWIARQRNLPRDVVVYFDRKGTRNIVIQAAYNHRLQIQGQVVTVLKEIPSKMLRWRKEFAFLTEELKKRECQFRWDVPTGIILIYQGKRYRLNTVEKAREFYKNVLQASDQGGNGQKTQRLAIEGQKEAEEQKTQMITRSEAKKQALAEQEVQQRQQQQTELKESQIETAQKSEAVGGARPKTKRINLNDLLQKLQFGVDDDQVPDVEC